MPFETQDNQILYTVDGRTLARVTFPKTGPDTVDIDHTFVDPSLRGQGIAGQLMEQTAAALRRTGRRAALSCSYARQWFERHPEWQDVLDTGAGA